jgi:hypothetical protein
MLVGLKRTNPFLRGTAVKKRKVKVSERALVARINRVLHKESKTLRRCRASSRWVGELGAYYTLDLNRNMITLTRVDLATLGRELKVLDEWEELAEE